MSTFRVKPDTLKAQATVYQNVSVELDNLSSQTQDIADSLDMSLAMVKPAVEQLVEQIKIRAVKAEEFGAALTQIANEYTNTEDEIKGNIKAPGNYNVDPSDPGNGGGNGNGGGGNSTPAGGGEPLKPSDVEASVLSACISYNQSFEF